MPTHALLIRPVREADIRAITAIYADAVAHRTATFEIDAPDVAEMARYCAKVKGKGLPWLVAGRASTILGYAYAAPLGHAPPTASRSRARSIWRRRRAGRGWAGSCWPTCLHAPRPWARGRCWR